MNQHRSTSAYVNLNNLKHNFLYAQSILGDNFLCPMVKANAYGHGDVEVSRALESVGAKILGVGLVEEGEILRLNGIVSEILVFGSFDSKDLKSVMGHKLSAVVSSWDQLKMLDQDLTSSLNVHIKFDTGMHRLGFATKDAPSIVERLKSNKHFHVKGVLTHLLRSDDLLDPSGYSQRQLSEFESVRRAFDIFNPVYHAYNSGGILLSHQYRQKNYGGRPGLLIYGVSPFGVSDANLKPVMTLKSKTVRYHLIKKGDSVSYNATWIASRESVIAVVPIGYADGYHRILSNRMDVLFEGHRCPVVGNVCMDYLMVDVTDVIGHKPVDGLGPKEVTLFGMDSKGNYLSSVELARAGQTIAWEVLTSVGERVPRIFVQD